MNKRRSHGTKNITERKILNSSILQTDTEPTYSSIETEQLKPDTTDEMSPPETQPKKRKKRPKSIGEKFGKFWEEKKWNILGWTAFPLVIGCIVYFTTQISGRIGKIEGLVEGVTKRIDNIEGQGVLDSNGIKAQLLKIRSDNLDYQNLVIEKLQRFEISLMKNENDIREIKEKINKTK